MAAEEQHSTASEQTAGVDAAAAGAGGGGDAATGAGPGVFSPGWILSPLVKFWDKFLVVAGKLLEIALYLTKCFLILCWDVLCFFWQIRRFFVLALLLVAVYLFLVYLYHRRSNATIALRVQVRKTQAHFRRNPGHRYLFYAYVYCWLYVLLLLTWYIRACDPYALWNSGLTRKPYEWYLRVNRYFDSNTGGGYVTNIADDSRMEQGGRGILQGLGGGGASLFGGASGGAGGGGGVGAGTVATQILVDGGYVVCKQRVQPATEVTDPDKSESMKADLAAEEKKKSKDSEVAGKKGDSRKDSNENGKGENLDKEDAKQDEKSNKDEAKVAGGATSSALQLQHGTTRQQEQTLKTRVRLLRRESESESGGGDKVHHVLATQQIPYCDQVKGGANSDRTVNLDQEKEPTSAASREAGEGGGGKEDDEKARKKTEDGEKHNKGKSMWMSALSSINPFSSSSDEKEAKSDENKVADAAPDGNKKSEGAKKKSETKSAEDLDEKVEEAGGDDKSGKSKEKQEHKKDNSAASSFSFLEVDGSPPPRTPPPPFLEAAANVNPPAAAVQLGREALREEERVHQAQKSAAAKSVEAIAAEKKLQQEYENEVKRQKELVEALLKQIDETADAKLGQRKDQVEKQLKLELARAQLQQEKLKALRLGDPTVEASIARMKMERQNQKAMLRKTMMDVTKIQAEQKLNAAKAQQNLEDAGKVLERTLKGQQKISAELSRDQDLRRENAEVEKQKQIVELDSTELAQQQQQAALDMKAKLAEKAADARKEVREEAKARTEENLDALKDNKEEVEAKMDDLHEKAAEVAETEKELDQEEKDRRAQEQKAEAEAQKEREEFTVKKREQEEAIAEEVKATQNEYERTDQEKKMEAAADIAGAEKEISELKQEIKTETAGSRAYAEAEEKLAKLDARKAADASKARSTDLEGQSLALRAEVQQLRSVRDKALTQDAEQAMEEQRRTDKVALEKMEKDVEIRDDEMQKVKVGLQTVEEAEFRIKERQKDVEKKLVEREKSDEEKFRKQAVEAKARDKQLEATEQAILKAEAAGQPIEQVNAEVGLGGNLLTGGMDRETAKIATLDKLNESVKDVELTLQDMKLRMAALNSDTDSKLDNLGVIATPLAPECTRKGVWSFARQMKLAAGAFLLLCVLIVATSALVVACRLGLPKDNLDRLGPIQPADPESINRNFMVVRVPNPTKTVVEKNAPIPGRRQPGAGGGASAVKPPGGSGGEVGGTD
eukprot:g5259.t1